MNMRRFLALSALALFAFAATPASAGTVYVTLATKAKFFGKEYQTVLFVANPTAQTKVFTTNFIGAGTDGVDRPEGVTFPETTVPPGQTIIVRDLVPDGSTGMLEITGDSELVIRARLQPEFGNSPGGEIAIVTSDNVRPALTDIYLKGLHKDGARASALGITNISQDVVNCNIGIETAAGGVLSNPLTVAVAPLSMLYTRDLLGLVQNDSGTDVQAIVRCSGQTYPFAHVVNRNTGAVLTVDPSTRLDSRLVPPGVKLPCPDGSVCFEQSGVFHTPSGANPVFRANIPLESGVTYRKIRVQLTARHGGWFGPMQSGIHNFFWIFDTDWKGTYGYMNARGPNKNVVTMLTKAGLSGSTTSRPDVKFGLSPGTTYVVDYLYDAESGNISGTLSTLSGTVVASLTDVTRVNRVGPSGTLQLWVGNPDERSHGFFEVPSINWDYSDLRVEVSP